MYDLFAKHYDAVTEQIFLRDLESKDAVVFLRDQRGALAGFAVFQFLVLDDPFPCQVIYSGDIIVHPDFWGKHDLLKSAFELAGNRKARRPDLPLYWCVTIKGVRTWRLLPLSFNHYWPNPGATWPKDTLGLRNSIGKAKFGDHFDPDTGIVWSGHSVGHLSPTIADTPSHLRCRPEVRFFLDQNPGYLRGQELLCIAPAEHENFRPVARRWFEAGMETT